MTTHLEVYGYITKYNKQIAINLLIECHVSVCQSFQSAIFVVNDDRQRPSQKHN